MSETLGLKNVNMLSKEQYDGVAEPTNDELWAVSGLGVGFPGDRYIDLTLGASGTEYTAPASGYFVLDKQTSGTDQRAGFYNTIKKLSTNVYVPISNNAIRTFIPVKKGDVVQCNYNAGGTTNVFRFIYAEGEE
jgi:hypothetical protein